MLVNDGEMLVNELEWSNQITKPDKTPMVSN